MMFLLLQLAFWLVITGLLGFGAGWFLQARRMGAKMAEQRERSRQHIQRLELGLAEADEVEPYAKETREPVEVSENPEAFLSGMEGRREESQLADEAVKTQAESSGLANTQTVTLSSLRSEPEVKPAVDDEATAELAGSDVSSAAVVDDSGVDRVADTLVAPAAAQSVVGSPAADEELDGHWQQRLRHCEQSIESLRADVSQLQRRGGEASTEGSTNFAGSAASELPSWAMTAPDGAADDLKRIWGVGPRLEEMLHDMGIYHFHQIAAFSPQDVESVSAQLDEFSDRVKRDDWVSQAKKLMAEV